jgi:hypothetical protein
MNLKSRFLFIIKTRGSISIVNNFYSQISGKKKLDISFAIEFFPYIQVRDRTSTWLTNLKFLQLKSIYYWLL